jgi:hypothetical protein
MASKPTISKEVIKPTKWEVVYEDEESISIWRYNSKITIAGPVEVEYKWKRSFNPWGQKKKTLGDLAKDAKKKQKLEKSQLGIDYSS